MNPADYTSHSPGYPIRVEGDFWAFVPNPLPPDLAVSWELVSQNSAADRALGELAGVARTLPNPRLLIGPFMRLEAVLSSRIEGIQASLSDLLIFEGVGDRVEPQHSDVREVMNYVAAMQHGLALLDKIPVSLRLIREMHRLLMTGVSGENRSAGDFRRIQNWIGGTGTPKTAATYVPPPLPEMMSALHNLEKYLHTPTKLPSLVRLALIHYQFEAIHPFVDGNGRIGRLLITLLLCAENILPQPLLYLSAYFERHRQEYYRLLLAVSQRGAWSEWLEFFLRGVAQQSSDAIIRSRLLLDLWHSYRQEVQSARSSALLLRLVDELFNKPVVTIASAARVLEVTPRAAQQNVDKLVQAGIVLEATGRRRNRVFVAPAIIKIIEATDL